MRATDLLELVAQAPFYEKFSRIYISLVVGSVDKSALSNAAFGNIFLGKPIGSTQYINSDFANLAPKMPGTMVQIGTISNGTVHLTYPQTLDRCNNIKFSIAKDGEARSGEPVYMLLGWAACLALRPPHQQTQKKDEVRYLHFDIHGSPLYAVPEVQWFKISIKRVSDGRLIGKPSMFGIMRPPHVTDQGIYGNPCGCNTPDPRKKVDAWQPTAFNGVRLSVFAGALPFWGNVASTLTGQEQEELTYDDMRIIWQAGDLPMQLFEVYAYPYSTYMQVPGECLSCAINRALGTGRWLLIAGSLPLS